MSLVLPIVAIAALGFIASKLYASWKTRHAITVLSQLRCPACHTLLGTETAKAAHERYIQTNKESKTHKPAQANADVREWPVCCSHCQAESYFAFDTLLLYADPHEGRALRREINLGLRQENGMLDIAKVKAHIADQAERCLRNEITYPEFADAIPSDLEDDYVSDVNFYVQHMPPENRVSKQSYANDLKEAHTAIDRLRQSITSETFPPR